MTASRPKFDRNGRVAARISSDTIAVALDGVPAGEHDAVATYRAAVASLTTVMGRPLQRLQRLSAAGLVAASARFDNTHRLLDALGIAPISTCEIAEDGSWPGVLLVGCMGVRSPEQHRWFERMLDRGAVIVTSDRTARIPVIASRLNVATTRPSSRARVAVRPTLVDRLEQGNEWGRLVSEMHPAVRMAAGHLTMSREQPINAKIFADDAMTDAPLAVLAPIGAGQVLHAAAHWWQDVSPDSSEAGQRLLATVPAFATVGSEHGNVRFGWFGAASVMLAVLLAGLDDALDCLDRQLPTSGIIASLDGA